MAAEHDAARRKARKSSATEEELQTFSYIVAHDVAASVRHLSEFSRLLVGEFGDGLTDRQRKYADHIRAASDHCVTMLEQLLLYSHVQQRALVRVRHDATSTLRPLMARLAVQAKAAGAEILLEPLGDVYADPELLGVVFLRLMDNAIKFARPDTPPRIVVQGGHDKAFWRMRICDNGVGVEPAYREEAFRMFRRLHGGNTYPGVGAGLAICRRIARLHGGDTTFLDCAEGSCVELALPNVVRSARHARHSKEIENGAAQTVAHGR